MCVEPREWQIATELGLYEGSSQDRADGFIHFSTFDQVEQSTAKHRPGQDNLLLIGANVERLGDALKFEPSRGGQLFPHLYGPLPLDSVIVREPVVWLPEQQKHRFPPGFDSHETQR